MNSIPDIFNANIQREEWLERNTLRKMRLHDLQYLKKKVLNQILLNLIEGEETEIKKLLNFK